MNKLSAEQIDKELMDRDERKPIRKLVDDKIGPAATILAGGAIAGASALANIKTVNRLHQIE